MNVLRQMIARIARVSVLVAGYASATMLVSGCGTRATRPAPSPEPRSPSPAEPTPVSAVVATESSTTPSDQPSPAPLERLAWVNPARCVTPCTYDPADQLVRVDDAGVSDPSGKHLVHRSIQERLRDLVSAARAAGHKLRIESAFRSYEEQSRLFRRIKQSGRAARPGHSEHQLGTAVDFRLPTSAAIAWLADHASAHGFVLSYRDGKQRVTGYRPEPWHLRFVGDQLANELRTNGSTLEELFRARPDLGESGTCDDCPLAASRTPCGAITVAGTCNGTVLQWCYDNSLASVDCAASKERCARAAGVDAYDCIAP